MGNNVPRFDRVLDDLEPLVHAARSVADQVPGGAGTRPGATGHATMGIGEALRLALATYQLPPRELNRGLCHAVAGFVAARVPGARVVWGCDLPGLEDAPCHAFVAYGGRFYDAEAVAGVDHVLDLPFYQREVSR